MVNSPVRSEEKMKPHRDHPAGDDTADGRPAAPSSAPDHPLEITHAQMDAAHETGEAVPFSQTVPWLVRHDGSWWVVYERGWLRITDELTAVDIDQRAAEMPGEATAGFDRRKT